MRQDFNKLLTERQRIGHANNFGRERHVKLHQVIDEDGVPIGGREGMKARYCSHGRGSGRKSFNENLNPLRNFLHGAVGRQWDAIYSELCKNFDRRKVINDHIFQHLFQYVEINTFMHEGVVCYRRWSSIEECKTGCDYYVDPRDGIMKRGDVMSYKARHRLSAEKKALEDAKIFRTLNKDQELRLINGVWFIFTWKDLPPKKTWMVEDRVVSADTYVTDVLTGEACYSGESKYAHRVFTSKFPGWCLPGRYRALKQTASHKTLKKAGLV